jgi:long-chain acyl-CoA synthetase
MYQDAPANEFVYVLNDARIAYAIVEDQEQVDKMLEGAAAGAVARARDLRRSARPAQLRRRRLRRRRSYDALVAAGRAYDKAHPGFFDGEVAKGKGSDVSIMLYTSGTTGKPKGVRQSHTAFITAAEGGASFDRLTADDSVLSYLPMAWVGDHLFSFAQWLVTGFTINCPESADTVRIDLREIGPTYYFAPPAIFESLRTQVMIRMEDAARSSARCSTGRSASRAAAAPTSSTASRCRSPTARATRSATCSSTVRCATCSA